MRVLIVHAHPEPKSFNGAMTDTAVAALAKAGHEVVVSDLYAAGFKAVADRDDFVPPADTGYFKVQAEQAAAIIAGTQARDIAAEQEKLLWSEAVVFQFPLWWFSVPAVLKGWFDRVLGSGFAYGGGKWYDKGALTGRRAMLSVTTGAPAPMFESDGINGPMDQILFPLNHGVLYFCGFTVLPPFVAYAVARANDDRRAALLEAWRRRVLDLDRTVPLEYPRLEAYGPDFRLARVEA